MGGLAPGVWAGSVRTHQAKKWVIIEKPEERMVPSLHVLLLKEGEKEVVKNLTQMDASWNVADCLSKQSWGSWALWGVGSVPMDSDSWLGMLLPQLYLLQWTGRALFYGLCSVTETWPRWQVNLLGEAVRVPWLGRRRRSRRRWEDSPWDAPFSGCKPGLLNTAVQPFQTSLHPPPYNRAEMCGSHVTGQRETKESVSGEAYGRN